MPIIHAGCVHIIPIYAWRQGSLPAEGLSPPAGVHPPLAAADGESMPACAATHPPSRSQLLTEFPTLKFWIAHLRHTAVDAGAAVACSDLMAAKSIMSTKEDRVGLVLDSLAVL